MSKYKIPDKYFHRIHHIRPRFKNNVENVLIYIATEISKIDRQSKVSFDSKLDTAIRKFPGNANRVKKTINNWRTEISSLFGFYQTDGKESWKGLRAIELSESQDLVLAFKIFLFHFQWPGGHLKNHENLKLIHAGVKFHPTNFILSLLRHAEKKERKRESIDKAELTHCAFNDLRVTRDHERLSSVWKRIKENRKNKVEYDWTGDVIRYAGDILDYMEIANLLVSHGNKFYLNSPEKVTTTKFIKYNPWFSLYDRYIGKSDTEIKDIKPIQNKWFEYTNKKLEENFFQTDLLAVLAKDDREYKALQRKTNEIFEDRIKKEEGVRTKEIGDIGENLIYAHECMRIKNGGKSDILHLIKCIPNALAVGFDINSRELNETFRCIEVKTTISSRALSFNRFTLTKNEWNAAVSFGKRYYVYRLFISKGEKRLFVIQDPVKKYKKGKLALASRNGKDISFDPSKCGEFVELLEWNN